MILKNLPDDEDECWVAAWGLGSKHRANPISQDVLITNDLENLRMQGFVYEWAMMGYAPAQRAWARRIAARL